MPVHNLKGNLQIQMFFFMETWKKDSMDSNVFCTINLGQQDYTSQLFPPALKPCGLNNDEANVRELLYLYCWSVNSSLW